MADIMPETMGCQLWGVMGRFLTYAETTTKELDAIKRRMFSFEDIMRGHGFRMQDIQELKTLDELRSTINELDPFDIGEMFF